VKLILGPSRKSIECSWTREVDGAIAGGEQLAIELSFLLHVVVEYGIN
jgi:hypothetical protein